LDAAADAARDGLVFYGELVGVDVAGEDVCVGEVAGGEAYVELLLF